MLDEKEKNAALSDKKKRLWISQVFQKQKFGSRILYCVQVIS